MGAGNPEKLERFPIHGINWRIVPATPTPQERASDPGVRAG